MISGRTHREVGAGTDDRRMADLPRERYARRITLARILHKPRGTP